MVTLPPKTPPGSLPISARTSSVPMTIAPHALTGAATTSRPTRAPLASAMRLPVPRRRRLSRRRRQRPRIRSVARIDCASSGADRATQQLQRAGAGEFRGFGIKRCAPGAVEAVFGAVVDEHLGVAAAGERIAHLVPHLGGNRRVLCAEVELDRALHRLRLADEGVDAAAVVA